MWHYSKVHSDLESEYLLGSHLVKYIPDLYFHHKSGKIASDNHLPGFKAEIRVQYIFIYQPMGLLGWVFNNGLADQSSIPGQVITKTKKIVLDAALLNAQHYKVRIKGKVEHFRERSSAPCTLWCSSSWKGRFLVALDYGCQLYFFSHMFIFSFCLWMKKDKLDSAYFSSRAAPPNCTKDWGLELIKSNLKEGIIKKWSTHGE